MKDIVNEILETEKKVESTLQDAREKAQAVRQQTEKEAQEQISRAREEARAIVQNAVEMARREAEEVRQKRLKEAEAAAGAFLIDNKDKIDRLVEDVVKLVIRTAYSGDRG